MTKRFFGLVVALILGMSVQAHAAAITWGAVKVDTGTASDVITTGAFVDSATINAGDVTVNGVLFNGDISGGYGWNGAGTAQFGHGSNITINKIAGGGQNVFGAPSGWPTANQLLVSGTAYAGGGQEYVVLGGLMVGQQYQVQLFTPQWNAQYLTYFSTTSDFSSDNSNLLNVGVGSTLPNNVAGLVIADAATETIYVGGTTSGLGLLSSVELRTAATVPEPSTLMILAAPMLTAFAARRRRTPPAA
jgi:hypothetical protein